MRTTSRISKQPLKYVCFKLIKNALVKEALGNRKTSSSEFNKLSISYKKKKI